jgi:hypothetical protein
MKIPRTNVASLESKEGILDDKAGVGLGVERPESTI